MSRRRQQAVEEEESVRCPYCQDGEPSVWDHVLFHYAHPAPNDKLKFCHEPWRERCRRCSASIPSLGGPCTSATCDPNYRCTCLRHDQGFGTERHTRACARRHAENAKTREAEDSLTDQLRPSIHDGGIPMCSHMVCPKYERNALPHIDGYEIRDRNICTELGRAPDAVCVPAVKEMASQIVKLKTTLDTRMERTDKAEQLLKHIRGARAAFASDPDRPANPVEGFEQIETWIDGFFNALLALWETSS